MVTAFLIARNVQPLHTHDCDQCIFLGRCDSADLYVCKGGGARVPRLSLEYVRRFSSKPADYASLGDLAPPGSVYALCAALVKRLGPTFQPNEYRTFR
jgi:hypothetical protein